MRFLFGIILGLVLLAPRVASATTIKRFESAEIEDFAKASTHVVVARLVRVERRHGTPPGPPFSVPALYGKDPLARFVVEDVIAGTPDVASHEILVMGGYAEHATERSLLFLVREDDRYHLVALFAVEGANVTIAMGDGLTTPLARLVEIARAPTPAHVDWTVRVADRAKVGGALAVVFTASNAGRTLVSALPPSRCASVKAYPLEDDGLWKADEGKWFEQPMEWFAKLDEHVVPVAPGETHDFAYEIPLSQLTIDKVGLADVVLGMSESFCRAPDDERMARPHALENWMADRVVRVRVEAGAAAPLLTTPPPAWKSHPLDTGWAAQLMRPSGAGLVAAAAALAVAAVLWRRRQR